MRAAELEDQVAGGTMSPKIRRKALTSTLWKALRKCSHGHLNEIFSSSEEEMGFHLEISQIRLARKANGRVQHLSSGNLLMAAFEVTPYGRFCSDPRSLRRVRFCFCFRDTPVPHSGSLTSLSFIIFVLSGDA
jgi:hypothetical protein